MKLKSVALSLGSNIGNREENIKNAINSIIIEISGEIKIAPLFETDPWGNKDQPKFLNTCILLDTNESPKDILNKILVIEKKLGRDRVHGTKWQSRIIDIDIIYFGNQIIETDDLIIPHPLFHQRLFVLEPLSKISPHWQHPIFHKNITQLLQICPNQA